MEDQGKRLLLAVAVAFAIMMVWQMLFPPPKPEPKKEAEVAETAEQATDPGESAGETAPTGEPSDPVPPPVRGEEKFFDFETDKIHARFSSYGGTLKSWELQGSRLRVPGTDEPENLVRVREGEHEFLRVWFPDSSFDIPKGSEWQGERLNDREVRFRWESKDLRVDKHYKLFPDDYLLELKISVELLSAESAKQTLAVSLFSQQDLSAEGADTFTRVEQRWGAACFYDDEIHASTARSLHKKGPKDRAGSIHWGGFDHAYFLAAAAFREGAESRSRCNAYPLEDVEGGIGLDLIRLPAEIKRNQPGIRTAVAVYLGPKYMDSVEEASEVVGFSTKFEESIDLGYLAIIAGPLLGLLTFFQGFVINWGIAIFLLTLVVKGLTLPWTHKSMKSMKAMAKLKPQLEKIKEKHKDDRNKQNMETMALFKAHKVNPMSGCLPMLLQMPIWFALYRALTVAAELYQAPLIPGWIDDLTAPDPYYVLPVALTGMMFLQTRLTPTTSTGTQQKILMYGMPIMFGVFSFFFPAGLTLYIFTNTVFTALHHLYMSWEAKQEEAAVAVRVAGVAKENEASVEVASTPEKSSGHQPTQGAKGSKAKQGKKKSGNKGKKKRRR